MGAYESLNTWTGSANTSWTNTGNWSAGIVPVSGRSPVISNSANIIISSAVTFKRHICRIKRFADNRFNCS